MDHKKLRQYFLLALLAGVIIAVFFILRPFIYVVILALVFATIFYPVHRQVLSFLGNRRGLAALMTTIIIIIVIVIPSTLLGIKIFKEAQEFYFLLTHNGSKDIVVNIVNDVLSAFKPYLPAGQEFAISTDQYVKQGLSWLLSHLGYAFGSITKMTFNFLIFIVVTYYLLKDGLKFKKAIITTSPLADDDDEMIFEKMKTAIHSVIKSNLIIALAQGALVAIGFALFGVPGPMLWGIAATVASFIPGIGTAIVVIPAVIFTFITSGILWAGGLLLWGTLIVGLIDNFLKPILIGQEMKIHPLVIFLSVLGGIVLWGPMGFLLGPVTISLLFALLDILPALRDGHTSAVHKVS